MERIICIIIGYIFGLFQTAFIFGKVFKHMDIRTEGSGNSGTTNAFRVMGKKAGIAVFIGDFLKVVIAFFIARLLFGGLNFSMYAALGCVLGHTFPFYMGFKGGKGIACSLGLMLCISPVLAVVTYLIGFCVFKVKSYISLASLTMAAVFPILMAFCLLGGIMGFDIESVVIMFIISALAFYKHKKNISRLLSGTENKFSVKKE